MAAPTFPLSQQAASTVDGISLALTLDVTPENPVLGDLDLADGQIHLWGKREARVQKVRIILLFGKGEWYLNPEEGIPYFNSIIGTKRKRAVLGIYRQAFLKTLPDLASIRVLTMEFDGRTREAHIDFDLLFDDGMVISSKDFGALEITV